MGIIEVRGCSKTSHETFYLNLGIHSSWDTWHSSPIAQALIQSGDRRPRNRIRQHKILNRSRIGTKSLRGMYDLKDHRWFSAGKRCIYCEMIGGGCRQRWLMAGYSTIYKLEHANKSDAISHIYLELIFINDFHGHKSAHRDSSKMNTHILDFSTISFIQGLLILILFAASCYHAWYTCAKSLISDQALRRAWTNPLSFLRGPPISRWTGIILDYHWLAGSRARYVHALHQKYGSYWRLISILLLNTETSLQAQWFVWAPMKSVSRMSLPPRKYTAWEVIFESLRGTWVWLQKALRICSTPPIRSFTVSIDGCSRRPTLSRPCERWNVWSILACVSLFWECEKKWRPGGRQTFSNGGFSWRRMSSENWVLETLSGC